MGFRHITARDKPETVARNATKHEEQLKRALRIAISRAARSSETIKRLLRSATVQGKVEGQNIKAGIVSFEVEPFRGAYYQFWSWQALKDMSDQELASWVLRNLKRAVQRKMRRGPFRGPSA